MALNVARCAVVGRNATPELVVEVLAFGAEASVAGAHLARTVAQGKVAVGQTARSALTIFFHHQNQTQQLEKEMAPFFLISSSSSSFLLFHF